MMPIGRTFSTVAAYGMLLLLVVAAQSPCARAQSSSGASSSAVSSDASSSTAASSAASSATGSSASSAGAAPTAGATTGNTSGTNVTANFGGILKLVSPPVIWQFKPRYPLGAKIPIQYYYDSMVTQIPQTLGIAIAPQDKPDKIVVLTKTQPGNANFTFDSSQFADQVTEGWWVLKIWDMRNGDEKKGPITAPTEAGYMRPYVGNYNPFGLYTGSPYVDDPNYCPMCSAGATLAPSIATVFTMVAAFAVAVGRSM